MNLGFNWIDWVIILILILFAVESLGRILILEILDLISFLLAGFLSFSYYNFPAKLFENSFSVPHGLSLVLGFMTVWFISEIIFFFLVRFILPFISKIKILRSKTLSVIPSFLRGIVFISVALVMLATFPIQPSIKKSVLDSNLGSKILKNAYKLEQPVKSVFGKVANDSLTFLTIEPKTNEKVNLGFQTNQISTDEQSENIMFDLVNKERIGKGLNALKSDQDLKKIARAYSADMFQRGYFSHYSPEGKTVADRVLNTSIDFLVVGENLAYAPDIELAHQGLMNSPGHRENILSTDYHKIGIGVMDGGVYGRMFTQVFSN